MSATFGNYIGSENAGNLVNSPISGVIGAIDGVFRVTTTPQTVITARIPANPLGTDQVAGSELLTISPNLIIPLNAYVTEVSWMLPGSAFSPNQQSFVFNVLTGTSTNTLKVATAAQGVASTVDTGTDADRTVNLYSTVTAGTSVGSGISVANIPVGFGFPQWVDIPIQIKYWLAPTVDALSYIRGQII